VGRNGNGQERDTQHTLLIPLGYFAQEIGLISGIEAIKLSQKFSAYTPRQKVLEFFVAIWLWCMKVCVKGIFTFHSLKWF
jgi:hypothetical protein